MKSQFSYRLLFVFLVFLFYELTYTQTSPWTELSQTNKPWTRWWWHGSSITQEEITSELQKIATVGIGGVEITPIYGIIGEEDHFIPYLSSEWMEMLEHTLREAKRLDLGVDMATGTGWPFGGPWITEENACQYLVHKTWKLSSGETLNEPIHFEQDSFVRYVVNPTLELFRSSRNKGDFARKWIDPPVNLHSSLSVAQVKDPISQNPDLQTLSIDQIRFPKPLMLQCLTAHSDAGQTLVLTNNVSETGRLDWKAPQGNWTLYAAFSGWHGKMVERAAPGGEGNVIDHFSSQAISDYLARFDVVLEDRDISSLRAFFNDSYEVDDARGQANWTPNLFNLFRELRGYDLEDHLHQLLDPSFGDDHVRVLSDYRQTIADLLLINFTQPWMEWSGRRRKIIRNQSHGSPGNILDLYAASDIPETEGTEIIRAKFASSAGNIAGKQLISAEAATWLGEHFLSDLGDLKENIDRYFISGVNHIFYHGTCYSPSGEDWPGRLFYAAIHANDRNPLWRDWPTFNQYVTRVQSVLQQGVPKNDILLYFPIHDWYATEDRELVRNFHGHGPQLEETQVKEMADHLLEEGYTFDFISDKQIQALDFLDGSLVSGSATYQTVLVPTSHYFSLETIEKLVLLAEQGADIIFQGGLPQDVPGYHNLENRREKFETIIENLSKNSVADGRIPLGDGHITISTDLLHSLHLTGASQELMVQYGLGFTRRIINGKTVYLVTNWTGSGIDQWIPLGEVASSILLADPMTGRTGRARLREAPTGTEVYLQMDHGVSLLIFMDEGLATPLWSYIQDTGDTVVIKGPWNLHFTAGGPELPSDRDVEETTLWSEIEGDTYRDFSGTGVYSTSFDHPGPSAGGWIMDLGNVYETAEIELNGHMVAVLTGPSYRLYLDQGILQEVNDLKITVSNLMANRIAHLDRNNIWWKKFYNINFPPRIGENRGKLGLFDASSWNPSPSGIQGPVKLIPVETKNDF